MSMCRSKLLSVSSKYEVGVFVLFEKLEILNGFSLCVHVINNGSVTQNVIAINVTKYLSKLYLARSDVDELKIFFGYD